ncbi:hypothetical protein KW800_01010 [Candidatus Parcubacteria bacterium]|nr:hypothetical protein [Candidatus Parcubacteria bacterium]
MRKSAPYIAALVLAISIVGFVPVAHAQNVIPDAIASIGAKAAGLVTLDFIGTILSPLVLVLLKLTSFLTMLGGVALNAAVYFTVTKMAENFANLPAIDTAWGVIRDVANMGFIFVLLYTAIMTIFGEGNYRETIVRTVIAAILINFSLFFTKVIIDASNLLALTFYRAIAPSAGADFLSSGISNAIVEPMGITTLWQASGGALSHISNFSIMGILASIVLLVSAFIFFAIGIMFVIRYVVLIFVLILSPIAFVANILPGVKKYSGQWWDALLGQAFFAPIYFLLTWVSIVVIQGITKANLNGAPSDFSAALSGTVKTAANGAASAHFEAGLVPTFLNFIVIIAFLIVSLIVSKSWAERAGSGVKKLTGAALGLAGGTSLGLAGRFNRGTVGRLGQAVADSEALKKTAVSSSRFSKLAKYTLAAGRGTAASSFDLRATPVGGALDAGKAQKGGFAADLKNKIKGAEQAAENFKPSDIVISDAEKKLEAAKQTGNAIRIAAAQKDVDDLKGVNEDEARKRKQLDLIKNGFDKKGSKAEMDRLETERTREVERLKATGLSEKEAKDQAKAAGIGWAPEEVKSAQRSRAEAYAKEIEEQKTFGMGNRYVGFDTTGRVLIFGPVKRENLAGAIAIRKKAKDKKPADKLAEELNKAGQAAEDAGAPATPATPPTGGGVPPPATPTP